MVIVYIYYKYRTNQKLIRDISQRIRQNATEIEMYQEQIHSYRNLQKETLRDYRNQIGELQGKVSVLEDQNRTLSVHLVEKKGIYQIVMMVIFMLSTCKDFVYY